MYFFLGTTWTQELVWMVVNNCDKETGKNIPLMKRSPFLEKVPFIFPRLLRKLFISQRNMGHVICLYLRVAHPTTN